MKIRTRKLIIDWFLMTVVISELVALSLAICFRFTGEVSTITSIKLLWDWSYVLPFGISLWWNFLAGPIFSTIMVFLLTGKLLTDKRLKKDENQDQPLENMVFGLIAGTLPALFVAMGGGLLPALVPALVVGLAIALVYPMGVGLVSALFAGLLVTLGAGLGAGLATTLGAGLVIILVIGLFALIKLRLRLNKNYSPELIAG